MSVYDAAPSSRLSGMSLARYGRRGLGCTTLNTELGWTTLWEDYGKRLPMYRHQGVGRGGPSLARSRHEAASGAASQQASLSSPWFRCARPLDPAGSSGPCVRSSVSCLGRCFTGREWRLLLSGGRGVTLKGRRRPLAVLSSGGRDWPRGPPSRRGGLRAEVLLSWQSSLRWSEEAGV